MDLSPDQSRLFWLWATAAEISAVGYTLYLVCAIASIVLLWKQRRTGASLGRRLTLPYTVVMFTASTVDFCLAMWTTGDSMISTVTGRVPQSLVACTTSNNVSTVFHMLPIFVSDALLLYRAYVILGKSKFWMSVPFALYCSTIALGFATNIGCTRVPSGETIFTQSTIKILAIGVYGVTIILNVVLTLSIIAKLAPATRLFSRNHPSSQRAVSVIAILAESAALYTVSGLAFTASLVARSDLEILFGSLFGIGAYLGSGIITLRIALGYATSLNESRTNSAANESRVYGQHTSTDKPALPSFDNA